MRSALLVVGSLVLVAIGSQDATAHKRVLGVNGLGRIGKLTLWNQVERKIHTPHKSFDHIVFNLGRNIGGGMHDIADTVTKDTSYGKMHTYIGGNRAKPMITDVNESAGTMNIAGLKVTVLREHRNPKDIQWDAHGVGLVVDTTGQFNVVNRDVGHPDGALRGHLERPGVRKAIISAPPKLEKGTVIMPADTVTTVMGINGDDYDPAQHIVISNASCTTTALAHMMKPIVDALGVENIFTASMATIHAATGTQEVLDRLAKAGATDLRKNRSILNNIILTSTGAAKTLALVMPELVPVGFMAECARIPTLTGSLIDLNLTLKDPEMRIRSEHINAIYEKAAAAEPHGRLIYDTTQNVSSDIIGSPRAAAIIEAKSTHTRAAERMQLLSQFPEIGETHARDIARIIGTDALTQRVTGVRIFAWYDNEKGSYTDILGDRIWTVHESM